jgi:hypothetical protein
MEERLKNFFTIGDPYTIIFYSQTASRSDLCYVLFQTAIIITFYVLYKLLYSTEFVMKCKLSEI